MRPSRSAAFFMGHYLGSQFVGSFFPFLTCHISADEDCYDEPAEEEADSDKKQTDVLKTGSRDLKQLLSWSAKAGTSCRIDVLHAAMRNTLCGTAWIYCRCCCCWHPGLTLEKGPGLRSKFPVHVEIKDVIIGKLVRDRCEIVGSKSSGKTKQRP